MAQMGRDTQKEFESTAAGILEDYSSWVKQHPDALADLAKVGLTPVEPAILF